MLTLAALLLHVAGIGGVDLLWPDRPAPVANVVQASPMQTRQVEPAPIVPTAVEAIPATETAPPQPRRNPQRLDAVKPVALRAVRAPVDPPPAASLASVVVDARADEPSTPTPAPPPIQLALAPTPADAPAASAPAADETLPHYRTKLPPALTMRYDLQRGMLRGNGELTWQPQTDRYELKLAGRVGSLAVLTQTSSGGLDATGLAPVRFTDQRMTRAATAVNFQRATGKITFSGPSTEYPLREGVQDRLSWMIQLSAIVSAEPRLRATGAKVGMWVVGSHGEAAVWMFRSTGPETIETPGGSVDAIKFVREARDAYDASVQVWLDPQRFLLPVRASQQSGPRDDPFELRVQSVTTTP